jgi:hypothetical protein
MGAQNSVLPLSEHFKMGEQIVKYGQTTKLTLDFNDNFLQKNEISKEDKIVINYLLRVSILDNVDTMNFVDCLDSFIGMDGVILSKYHKRLESTIRSPKIFHIVKTINELIELHEDYFSMRNNQRFMSKYFTVIEQILQKVNIKHKYLVIVMSNYYVVLKIKKNTGESCAIIEIDIKRDEIDIMMLSWK